MERVIKAPNLGLMARLGVSGINLRLCLEELVTETLVVAGITAGLVGFHGLKEAIVVAVLEPSADAFAKASEKLGCSEASICRRGASAVQSAVKSGKIERLNAWFGNGQFKKGENVGCKWFVSLIGARLRVACGLCGEPYSCN